MIMPLLVALALAAPEAPASSPAVANARLDEPDYAAPGRYAVEVIDGVWVDPARADRRVPWRAYLPVAPEKPAPVVFVSHGLGGDQRGKAWYGRHLASWGFAAIHLQHLQADGTPERFRDGTDRQSVILRHQDPTFALSALRAHQQESPWRDRVDPSLAGIAGHSLGARTTLAVAGQTLPGIDVGPFRDDRFLAAFAMSPSPPPNDTPAHALHDMAMPIAHLTGTRDESPLDRFPAADRRVPFDAITDVDQVLVIFADGTHGTFSGQDERDPGLDRHLTVLRALAIAWWRDHLLGDPEAHTWWTGEGLRQIVSQRDRVEVKRAQTPDSP
jgi:predicted dienelactone hydrolase